MRPFLKTLVREIFDLHDPRRGLIASWSSEGPPVDPDFGWLPAQWSVYADDAKAVLDDLPARVRDVEDLLLLPDWGAGQDQAHEASVAPAAALTAVLAACTKGCRVGALMPGSYLTSAAARQARHAHMSRQAVRWVVEGGARLISASEVGDYQVWAPLHGALVVYANQDAAPRLTRFFAVPSDDVGDEELINDFRQLMRQGGGNTRFGFVHRGELTPGDPLNADLYEPTVVERRSAIRFYGAVQRLDRIADFVATVSREGDSARLSGTSGTGLVPVLQGREIDAAGLIKPLGERLQCAASEDETLRPGDLCVRAVITHAEPYLAVAEIRQEDEAMVAMESVLVLRPRAELKSEDRLFLRDYLRSPHVASGLRPAMGPLRLTQETLGGLPVPMLNEALKAALADLSAAKDNLLEWALEVDKIRGKLVLEDAVQEAITHVFQAGQRVRQRVAAAKRVDELTYRVRTQFPLPLAYLWRVVDVSRANLDGYVRTLECAEGFACYLAILAVTNARAAGVELKALADMAERLSTTPAGVSFGDWSTILNEVAGRRFRAAAQGKQLPVPEVVDAFVPSAAAADALRSLQKARNDQAHGRGPRGAAIQDRFYEVRDALTELVHQCDFLSEYPLRLVEESRWDALQDLSRYDYRDLIGDHPLVPLSTTESSRSDLEQRSLYLVDRRADLHLLRPLLLRLECDVCGLPSTFAPDRYLPATQEWVLRSMEHGHAMTRSGLADAFRSAGLIAP